jgi:hypothetical protein
VHTNWQPCSELLLIADIQTVTLPNQIVQSPVHENSMVCTLTVWRIWLLFILPHTKHVIIIIIIIITILGSSLTASPQPLSKPVLHRVRSSASLFNIQYILVPQSNSVTAYVFFLVCAPLLCFLQWCVLDAVPTQDVNNSISFPSFYCLRIFLSSLIVSTNA